MLDIKIANCYISILNQNYFKKKWSKNTKCVTKLIIPIEAYLNDM